MNVKQRKPRFQGARRTGVRPILFLRSLKMELSALIVIATAIAFLVTFIPVVGGVIAFFGAMDVWGWNPWIAGILFLAVPALVMAGTLLRLRR